MIKLGLAILSVVLLSFGVWRMLRSKARRDRRELVEAADAAVTANEITIHVEEQKAEDQPERDAEQDLADAAQAAAVVLDELAAEPELERRADGVVGGLMPTSEYDEELGL